MMTTAAHDPQCGANRGENFGDYGPVEREETPGTIIQAMSLETDCQSASAGVEMAGDICEKAMKLEGGCYCGRLRYAAEGEPKLRAQCHCRECQYFSGGSVNMFMLMPPSGFCYTKGMPKQFTRTNLESAVTREFCSECGTHIATRRPGLSAVILKVGTLDNPSFFGRPQMAIYAIDKQPFHQIPEGLPTFERLPPR